MHENCVQYECCFTSNAKRLNLRITLVKELQRGSVLELVLLILVLAVVVAFAYDSGRNPGQKTRPNRATAVPFDATSTRPQPGKHTIHGSAYIVDGDTIVIQKTQIRLFGVDAPEINHPYGQKAKWTLVSLCKRQKIRAEVTDRDAHGRTVARCYLQDGRDLSAEMVKLGMAIDWPKFSGTT